MADFDIAAIKHHPYKHSHGSTHGHFADTPYTIPRYSAAAVPFGWMLLDSAVGDQKHEVESRVEKLRLGWDEAREPQMSFKSAWVQEGANQLVLLDTFFSAVEPKQSLVFFYAKKTPLSEDHRRVIVGVGKVTDIGQPTEYRYEAGKTADDLSGYLWERAVGHSIRPNFEEGFLFPYQELLEAAGKDSNIDLKELVAFSPDEYFANFSYDSELLSHDGAIASLLVCESVLQKLRNKIDGPWDQALKWINNQLNELWKVRGPFPGFGSALYAFGIEHGTLLAWHVTSSMKPDADPWLEFENVLSNKSELPSYLQKDITSLIVEGWEKLPETRKALLKLISRFELTEKQAFRIYDPTERQSQEIVLTDQDILDNPYSIFEEDIENDDPVVYGVIDRGMYPDNDVEQKFPVPDPSAMEGPVDRRRIRALMIDQLEDAALEGHTLLPSGWLIQRIRGLALKPACHVSEDTIPPLGRYYVRYINSTYKRTGTLWEGRYKLPPFPRGGNRRSQPGRNS